MSNIKFCLRQVVSYVEIPIQQYKSWVQYLQNKDWNLGVCFWLILRLAADEKYKNATILIYIENSKVYWKMNNVCKLIVAKCDHVTFVWALTVQENADNIFSFSASNKQFYIYRYIAAIKRFHLCFHAIKSDFFCVSSSRHFAILLYYGLLWSVAF